MNYNYCPELVAAAKSQFQSLEPISCHLRIIAADYWGERIYGMNSEPKYWGLEPLEPHKVRAYGQNGRTGAYTSVMYALLCNNIALSRKRRYFLRAVTRTIPWLTVRNATSAIEPATQ